MDRGKMKQYVMELKKTLDQHIRFNIETNKILKTNEIYCKIKKIGYEKTIEKATFLWFIRVIFIMYIEKNKILEFGNLLSKNIKKEQLIDICYKLEQMLPNIFKKSEQYILDLLSDDIYEIIKILTNKNYIPEKEWIGNAEILGWLYQYYISEDKDAIFRSLKTDAKITKEELPIATQLFTPDWIIKYMVENSLGRIWLEHDRKSDLRLKWKYFIEPLEQEHIVECRNIKSPIDIKVIDNCMGSGHILVYVFRVLMDIYKSCGYKQIDIPKLILTKNIYGLDIDSRVTKFAYLQLIVEATKYDKSFIKKHKQLNILEIKESNNIDLNILDIIKDEETEEIINYVINKFKNAKELGSLIKIDEKNYDIILQKIDKKGKEKLNKKEKNNLQKIKDEFVPLIEQAKILSMKYDVVVTNPPYMSKRRYGPILAEYLEKYYPNSKYEMYAAFIENNIKNMVTENGYVAMVTIHTWMFITMFEKLRKLVLSETHIDTMLHLGAGTFEDLNSFNVLATAFCLRKTKNMSPEKSVFIKLDKYIKIDEKKENFYNKNFKFILNQNEFFHIQEAPIVYWMSEQDRKILKECPKVKNYCIIKQGMATSNNDRFLRFWYEVDYDKIGYNIKNIEDAKCSNKKWFPYNKGGNFRKWYGNNELVINWENDGKDIKQYTSKLPQGTNVRIKSKEYYFKKGITWSLFGFENFGVRYKEDGYIFDVSASSMFLKEDELKQMLAFLSSKVAFRFLTYLAPTVNFQIKNIADLPYIKNEKYEEEIENLVDENIIISKDDWNDFETSWDFKKHPLIRNTNTIQKAFEEWENECDVRFKKLKENEEKINEIYIKLYGLENEMDKVVNVRDISIRQADLNREIKSFLSYFIGCLMGRYSLNKDGLIYRDENNMKSNDGIIVLTEDNIINKLCKFLEVIYGNETVEENIKFIAKVLGKREEESEKQCIIRYFLRNFYKEHIKMYKKRPIYWLFDSGKNDGFKCLVYIHKFNEKTISIIEKHVEIIKEEYKKYLENNKINIVLFDNISYNKKHQKQIAKLQELIQYEQKLKTIIKLNLNMDLDDGILKNYSKFKDILAKI